MIGYGCAPSLGLGLDVPYTSPAGEPKVGAFNPTSPWTWCGSVQAVQKMLQDLGHYTGAIDGVAGAGTQQALRAFGQQVGLPTSGGMTGGLCEALQSAWSGRLGSGVAPRAPSADAPVGRPLFSAATWRRMQQRSAGAPGAGEGGITEWWSVQPTWMKAMLIGGGALAVLGTAYVVLT